MFPAAFNERCGFPSASVAVNVLKLILNPLSHNFKAQNLRFQRVTEWNCEFDDCREHICAAFLSTSGWKPFFFFVSGISLRRKPSSWFFIFRQVQLCIHCSFLNKLLQNYVRIEAQTNFIPSISYAFTLISIYIYICKNLTLIRILLYLKILFNK